jgi:UDP-glucose 4-epimerase
MKLLVTGGAGYIGSHTAHQLVDAGHEIVVLDNLYSGHRWAVPAKAEFVEGSVGSRALIDSLLSQKRFDGVLHFAAHTEVGESVTNPAKYYRNNTVAALELFDACVTFGVPRLVFSSTAAVYGDSTSIRLEESEPLAPVNPYGASKMMSERLLRDIAAGSDGALKFVILRYFNVAGARLDQRIGQATPRATHLIKVAAETAMGLHESVIIHGTDYPTKDGTCLRDYIHVEDLAKAHLDALGYLQRGGHSDVFNVGYGRPYSVREVINTMKRVSGVDFRVVDGPRRPGDPVGVAADSTKIKRVLGWTPQHDSLELICQSAWNWEKTLPSKLKTTAKTSIAR